MNGPQFAYYYNMAGMMDKLANGNYYYGHEAIYTGIHKSKCGSDVGTAILLMGGTNDRLY
ncbi:hypothetical protein NXW00_28405 [Bacteroides thetaiotaomicron]|nr:hypothetical protein [Bacteroides thetaiotaomicron]